MSRSSRIYTFLGKLKQSIYRGLFPQRPGSASLKTLYAIKERMKEGRREKRSGIQKPWNASFRMSRSFRAGCLRVYALLTHRTKSHLSRPKSLVGAYHVFKFNLVRTTRVSLLKQVGYLGKYREGGKQVIKGLYGDVRVNRCTNFSCSILPS